MDRKDLFEASDDEELLRQQREFLRRTSLSGTANGSERGHGSIAVQETAAARAMRVQGKWEKPAESRCDDDDDCASKGIGVRAVDRAFVDTNEFKVIERYDEDRKETTETEQRKQQCEQKKRNGSDSDVLGGERVRVPDRRASIAGREDDVEVREEKGGDEGRADNRRTRTGWVWE